MNQVTISICYLSKVSWLFPFSSKISLCVDGDGVTKRKSQFSLHFIVLNLQISLKPGKGTSFPHFNMKINDKNCYILFCNRGFSDVLEGIGSKNFPGAGPQTPIFLGTCYETRPFWQIFVFYWHRYGICKHHPPRF